MTAAKINFEVAGDAAKHLLQCAATRLGKFSVGQTSEVCPTLRCQKIDTTAVNFKSRGLTVVMRQLNLNRNSQDWHRLIWLPSYCPKANPIERAFGNVHDKCTRTHTRKRLRTLVGDVERHLGQNGPWKYKLSEIYYVPAVQLELDVLRIRATQGH